jgi:hypothetical protein
MPILAGNTNAQTDKNDYVKHCTTTTFPTDKTRAFGKLTTMKTNTGAFGKLIIFGEHFVVYKVPALVGAVSVSSM